MPHARASCFQGKVAPMKLPEGDVVIVGSGVAGVSAAIPLVEAGLNVVMIDGGIDPEQSAPSGRLYDIRTRVADQWKLFVGKQFQALRTDLPSSPKFRAPTNAFAYHVGQHRAIL